MFTTKRRKLHPSLSSSSSSSSSSSPFPPSSCPSASAFLDTLPQAALVRSALQLRLPSPVIALINEYQSLPHTLPQFGLVRSMLGSRFPPSVMDIVHDYQPQQVDLPAPYMEVFDIRFIPSLSPCLPSPSSPSSPSLAPMQSAAVLTRNKIWVWDLYPDAVTHRHTHSESNDCRYDTWDMCIIPVGVSTRVKPIGALAWEGSVVLAELDKKEGGGRDGLEASFDSDDLGINLGPSPDGLRLAVGDHDSVRVFDLTTKKPLLTKEGGASGVTFSPCSRYLLAHKDGVRVLCAQTGTVVHAWTVLDAVGEVLCATFTHDGNHIVLGGARGIAMFLLCTNDPNSTSTSTSTSTSPTPVWCHTTPRAVVCLAHNGPAGSRAGCLVWGETRSKVVVWDPQRDKLVWELSMCYPVGVTWSEDGLWLGIADLGDGASVWSCDRLRAQPHLPSSLSKTTSFSFR